MRKRLYVLGIAISLAFCLIDVYAQQTIEEATDSIKNIMALAKKGDAVAQNEVGDGIIADVTLGRIMRRRCNGGQSLLNKGM